MLGNTISIDVGTIADPNVKVIPKVNQDGFASEYRLKETDRETSVLIRHSAETNKLFGQNMERHVVTVREFVYPTEILPLGKLSEVYTVIRCSKTTTWEELQGMIDGLSAVLAVEATQKAILNWES